MKVRAPQEAEHKYIKEGQILTGFFHLVTAPKELIEMLIHKKNKVALCGKFIYTVDGIIHFCIPNATTLVARTATHAMTGAIIPYLKCLAESGIDNALKECSEIGRGIYIDKGKIRKECMK